MSFSERLRNNLGLKILSLFIALVIWGLVHNQADPLETRQLTVRVEAINVPQNLAIAEIVPAQITAVVRGRRSVVQRLAYLDFHFVADASGKDIGTYILAAQPYNLPRHVQLEYLSSPTLKVTLDAIVTATRPIFIQTRGEPAPGVTVAGSSVRPAEVTVSGPSTKVRRVARVLAAVDISGRNQTEEIAVDLMPLDAGSLYVEGVKVEPPQAVVTVKMRFVNVRTVPVAPNIHKIPSGYEIVAVTVRPAVVTITGSPEKLQGLEAIATEPIEVAANVGQTQYLASLQLPAGVRVLGAASARVTVMLRRASRTPYGASAGGRTSSSEPQTEAKTSRPSLSEEKGAAPASASAKPPEKGNEQTEPSAVESKAEKPAGHGKSPRPMSESTGGGAP